MPRASRPGLLGLVVAGLLGIGVLAGGACATAGHSAPRISDADGEAPATGAGCTFPALGVSVLDAACNASAPTVDWSPVRRISPVEYDNMVRDLLGDTTQPGVDFSPESPMGVGINLQTNAPTSEPSVGTTNLQQYLTAAENLAQTAVATDASLAQVFSLNGIAACSTQDATCAQEFIQGFAMRAFRGQFDSTEAEDLLEVYDTIARQYDFKTGIQAVITAVLESPRFLYVFEFGDGTTSGDVTPLSSYEVAARLALFLWRSVPDPALLAAAASPGLTTVAQVQTQARRMLADPKAHDAIEDFTTQWMQLQGTASQAKDTQFTAWTAITGEEVLDETLTTVSQLVLADDGGLTDLFTSPISYINQDLAKFYGVAIGTGPSVTVADPALGNSTSATSFVATSLPNRSGVLTSASVMSTQAHSTLPSPVLRGKLVREDVLCNPVPDPPPGIPPAPTAPATDGGTTRSLFEAHENLTLTCKDCHQYMDPIGFAFGHFDASGAWQNTDANGFDAGPYPAIDATGQVLAMPTAALVFAFNGATDLSTRLLGWPQVRQCFALQQMRYALTRLETPADACSLQQAYAAFVRDNLNIESLMLSITGTDAFRYRSIVTPGSECMASTGGSCP